jgi:hypothetical protein
VLRQPHTIEDTIAVLVGRYGVPTDDGKRRRPRTLSEFRNFCRGLRDWLVREQYILKKMPRRMAYADDKDTVVPALDLNQRDRLRAVWHLLHRVAGGLPYPAPPAWPCSIDQAIDVLDGLDRWILNPSDQGESGGTRATTPGIGRKRRGAPLKYPKSVALAIELLNNGEVPRKVYRLCKEKYGEVEKLPEFDAFTRTVNRHRTAAPT